MAGVEKDAAAAAEKVEHDDALQCLTSDPKMSCVVSNPDYATALFIYEIAPDPADPARQRFEVALQFTREMKQGDPVLLLGVFGSQEPLCFPVSGQGGEIRRLRDFTGDPTPEEKESRRRKLAVVAELLRAHGNDMAKAEAALVEKETAAAAAMMAAAAAAAEAGGNAADGDGGGNGGEGASGGGDTTKAKEQQQQQQQQQGGKKGGGSGSKSGEKG